MNEFYLLICIIIITLIALIFFRKKEKKTLGKSPIKATNPYGILLDNLLKQKKGKELTSEQRSIIESNIGLYHWLPKDLIAPWEERIICFLEEFPITFMKREMPTKEMEILVAAEACLLIVNRPLSDYRHLKAIHLWEDEINGNKNARGSATRFEISLSWNYLKQSIKKARDGHNLTLHEFAHLIDFADDGIAQSIPVSRNSKDFKQWQELVNNEHKKLMQAYEGGKNYSIRAYGGYESIKGDKPELFSCGTSAFFERGSRLKRECPAIYNALQEFYGIDPANWRKAE
ncbi:zinc-dependent peptidase [Candidatus Seribacter sulfatis]|uniref:zinc-dependent peptidase n=1 Tax=Candidatus Seribacter sulfatis TaxID=3381756 RepID=UPI00389AC2A2